MPAASAIAPLVGAMTTNTPPAPAAPAAGDAFGQVLQSARTATSETTTSETATSGSAQVPTDGGSGTAAAPDQKGQASAEPPADQVTTNLTNTPVVAQVVGGNAGVAGKPSRMASDTRMASDKGSGIVAEAQARVIAQPALAAGDSGGQAILPVEGVNTPSTSNQDNARPPALPAGSGANGADSYAEVAASNNNDPPAPSGAHGGRSQEAVTRGSTRSTAVPGLAGATTPDPSAAASAPVAQIVASSSQGAGSVQPAATPGSQAGGTTPSRATQGGAASPITKAAANLEAAYPTGVPLQGAVSRQADAAITQPGEPGSAPGQAVGPSGGDSAAQPTQTASLSGSQMTPATAQPSMPGQPGAVAVSNATSPRTNATSLTTPTLDGPASATGETSASRVPAQAAAQGSSQAAGQASAASALALADGQAASTPGPAQVAGQVAEQRSGQAAAPAAGQVTLEAATAEHKMTARSADAAGDPIGPGITVSASVNPSAEQAAPSAPPGATTVEATTLAQPPSPQASLAEQIRPAVLTLAKAADGSQTTTVSLHPAELGMVQVKIAPTSSGGTQIEITAEKASTLEQLQRDQPQLLRTLDDAGISAIGRTVTFHVAPAMQAAVGGDSSGQPGGHPNGGHGLADRTNAGTADADGSGRGRSSYAARERNTYSVNQRSSAALAAADANAATAARTYRGGLDITA